MLDIAAPLGYTAHIGGKLLLNNKSGVCTLGRVVAVTNSKGGIGKTTTVVNVGAGMALMGARVLLVDADAQGNLSMALGVTPKRTLYDVLVDGVEARDCLTPARPRLDLLAADDTLLNAQPIISRRADWSRVLAQALAPLKYSYDFIFIDSPGSLTVLSTNALLAASEVLVPTTVEHLSIKGLVLLFKQIARVTVGSNIIRMIVPTMFNPRLRQSVALLEHLRGTYGGLVAPPIRLNVRLSECTSQGKTIYEYDPRSRGALDYAHLVKRLNAIWKFQPGQRQEQASENKEYNGQEPVPEPAQQNGDSHDSRRDMNYRGSTLPLSCPHCGHLLRRANVAGYRVVYCENCKYKQQELAAGVRR
jgi:chromosome partitioning protein